MDDIEAFERAWAKYGGFWEATWGDGAIVRGYKKPERPKLRLIQGGKRDGD